MCHYDPPEEAKQRIKFHCQEIVGMLNTLHEMGDPIGCSLGDIKKLLDHLYDPKSCDEKK